ncbi:hypothetical protein J1N35_034318 [Gossypium stocksii]|uniref:Uncharacterized protein n=1 Tax=Gossypium stocksii TaxID=47602 RepID=A0A9D3URS2_9ROSI|nr:hypothetical protein J1N35_034318 [Gossypium stocksii]
MLVLVASVHSKLPSVSRTSRGVKRLTSVYDNMSPEIATVAGDSHSEGGSERVRTRNGLVTPAPRFKQRKVSAVEDFLPGCSRLVKPQSIDLDK